MSLCAEGEEGGANDVGDCTSVAGSRTTSDVAPVTNVNLWWGLVMLLFGIIMLVLSRRAMKRAT